MVVTMMAALNISSDVNMFPEFSHVAVLLMNVETKFDNLWIMMSQDTDQRLISGPHPQI